MKKNKKTLVVLSGILVLLTVTLMFVAILEGALNEIYENEIESNEWSYTVVGDVEKDKIQEKEKRTVDIIKKQVYMEYLVSKFQLFLIILFFITSWSIVTVGFISIYEDLK